MFNGVLGNEQIKQVLKNSIEQNKVSHSYLFIGIDGIGKKIIAKEFAKTILCHDKEDSSTCKSCVEFESSNHPDFFEIEPDGNSIKIEQIRNMQKKVQEKPIISNSKVYVIDQADKMTVEAQNCLLKTLEEPPEFITIILIGSNESSFLSTIKSRCMILHFEKIDDSLIKEFLTKEYEVKSISQNMLEVFQGSIGKAIELKDKKELYEKIETIITNLHKKNIVEILNTSEEIYKSKDEIFEILDYINIILFRLAKSDVRYTNCIKIVENTKRRLKSNANYDMSIDYMLFSIWEKLERDVY